jgi:hypothetical protein
MRWRWRGQNIWMMGWPMVDFGSGKTGNTCQTGAWLFLGCAVILGGTPCGCRIGAAIWSGNSPGPDRIGAFCFRRRATPFMFDMWRRAKARRVNADCSETLEPAALASDLT